MLKTHPPSSDTTASDYQPGEAIASLFALDEPHNMMLQKLQEIFSENVLAKMLRVAVEALENNVSRVDRQNFWFVHTCLLLFLTGFPY